MFLAFSLHEAVNSFYGRLNAAVSLRHFVTPRSHTLPENCKAIITVPGGNIFNWIGQQTEELVECAPFKFMKMTASLVSVVVFVYSYVI